MKTGITPLGAVALVLFGVLVIAALQGCVVRTYKEGTTSYKSVSILAGSAVAPFELEAGKKGDASYRKLSSQGVTNETTAAIDAAVSAAVRAAKTP